MSRTGKWIAVLAAVVVLVICMPMIRFVTGATPVSSRTSYCCPYCAAYREVRTRLGITVEDSVHTGSFHEYYVRDVDSAHRHKWVYTSSMTTRLLGGSRCGDGGTLVPAHWFGRSGHGLVRILRTLPDRASRKMVMERLSGDMHRIPEMETILHSYGQDPNRKDWPKILQKLGLYTPSARRPDR